MNLLDYANCVCEKGLITSDNSTELILRLKPFIKNIDSQVNMHILASILNIRNIKQYEDLVYCVILLMKVLTREHCHRTASSKSFDILIVLLKSFSRVQKIVVSIVGVFLNLCYEVENAEYFANTNGPDLLLSQLDRASIDIQITILGTFQSLSFFSVGRLKLVEMNATDQVVQFLVSPSNLLRARAAATLHNITVVDDSLAIVRELGGIDALLDMINSEDIPMRRSAVGTLHNLAREKTSREIMQSRYDSFGPRICDLAACGDVYTQVFASAIILLLSSSSSKKDLVKALGDCIVMGIINSSFFSNFHEEDLLCSPE